MNRRGLLRALVAVPLAAAVAPWLPLRAPATGGLIELARRNAALPSPGFLVPLRFTDEMVAQLRQANLALGNFGATADSASGEIREFSIAYTAERDGNVIKKMELHSVAVVPSPTDPNCWFLSEPKP